MISRVISQKKDIYILNITKHAGPNLPSFLGTNSGETGTAP
jgi:hypothetical protein